MEEAGWKYKRVTSLLAGDGYIISPWLNKTLENGAIQGLAGLPGQWGLHSRCSLLSYGATQGSWRTGTFKLCDDVAAASSTRDQHPIRGVLARKISR